MFSQDSEIFDFRLVREVIITWIARGVKYFLHGNDSKLDRTIPAKSGRCTFKNLCFFAFSELFPLFWTIA